MSVIIKNDKGETVAGDAKMDTVVKAAAMLVNGWVEEDATGKVLYTSPGRKAALKAEEDSGPDA